MTNFMVSKLKIAQDWLPRYTGSQIDELGDYILLTNFKNYVTAFADRFNCEIKGEGGAMQSTTNSDGLSINKLRYRLSKCCFNNGFTIS